MKRSFLTSLTKNPFLSGSAIVLAGSLLTNILNYAFNLVAGRMLTPVEYGEAALLVTLSMLITAPFGSIRVLLTQRIAALTGTGDTDGIAALVSLTRRAAFFFGIGATLFLLALSPWSAAFFRVETLPLALLSFIVPVSLVASITLSIAQGRHAFLPLSLASVVATLVKLLGSIALIAIGLASNGVVLALIGSALATHVFLLSFPQVKRFFREQGTGRNERGTMSEERGIVPRFRLFLSRLSPFTFRLSTRNFFSNIPPYFPVALSATLLAALFGMIDVVLGKRLLDAESAGILSAVAVLGRIITYGGGAVVTVLLPFSATSLAQNERSSPNGNSSASPDRFLAVALAIVGASGIACLFLFRFFDTEIVSLLFGERYLAAAPFLFTFGVAMFFGSLSAVFISHFLARLDRFFVIPFVLATALFIGSVFFLPRSIDSIIRAELVSNVLLLLAFVAIFVTRKVKETRQK